MIFLSPFLVGSSTLHACCVYIPTRTRLLVLFMSVLNVFAFVHLRVYVCIDIYICIYTYMYTYMYMYACTCVYVCMFTYVVYVCMHGLRVHAQSKYWLELKTWSCGSHASTELQHLCNPKTNSYFKLSVFLYSNLLVKRMKSYSYVCSKIVFFHYF